MYIVDFQSYSSYKKTNKVRPPQLQSKRSRIASLFYFPSIFLFLIFAFTAADSPAGPLPTIAISYLIISPYICASTLDFNTSLGMNPIKVSTSSPFLNTFNVGTDTILNF